MIEFPQAMRTGRCLFALLALVALAACSTAHIDRVASPAIEHFYAERYPYYAELCAVSELKKKPGFGIDISSGMGGHSILYLNGVCRDHGSGTAIRLCDAETPEDQRGVGLSVNAHYRNANWVATPGRDFLFHGTLKPGERLTKAVYERTQARAKALGIYDGVEFHSDVFDDLPHGMSRRDYMYEVSVATDYAIGFGRDRYCARVPMNRDKMGEVVAYLNRLNAPYRQGSRKFDWNILNNNCSHVAHNALAAADVWDDWPMNQFILFAAFDFPVPKNEFVNLMRRTNDLPIDDIDVVYADAAARRALLDQDWLPTEPGALAEAEPAAQQNDLYDTQLHLIFYDDPIFGPYRRRFAEIFSKPRYTDLAANLRYFAGLYRKIERERQPLSVFLAAHGAGAGPGRDRLSRFYERYYGYVGEQESRTARDLSALEGAGARGAEERAPVAPAAPSGVPRS